MRTSELRGLKPTTATNSVTHWNSEKNWITDDPFEIKPVKKYRKKKGDRL